MNSGKEGRDTVVVMQMYSQGPLLSVAHPGPKLAAEEISPCRSQRVLAGMQVLASASPQGGSVPLRGSACPPAWRCLEVLMTNSTCTPVSR